MKPGIVALVAGLLALAVLGSLYALGLVRFRWF
jgi:hypothetical protein